MLQIADWLNELGLIQYSECFAEHGIDFSALPHLTDRDLKEIGVLLGHRRKLLSAICKRSVGAPRRRELVLGSLRPPIAPMGDGVGQRRYLAVMFCDLVGSTKIASQLDAEDWCNLVNEYFAVATAAVTEMGGSVVRKQGDGLLALFGFPIARENDTERAARAALAIQASLVEFNRTNLRAGAPELRARIGIDVGSVVVDAVGEIFGDVPNVAARVQALAEPETVMVTTRVQRHIAGLFVVEPRGSYELKGIPEPQMLFRLVRASGGGRRVGERELTPLTGRRHELALLLRKWRRARRGDGQLALIVGEPGIGKSRLLEELHQRLRETPHSWVEWTCSHLLQNTPLHPIGEWGQHRFGGAELAAERRLADLRNTLATLNLAPRENIAFLAPLLGIPCPNERAASLTPEKMRARQLAALVNWVIAGAKTQPVILAIEDLHWADPTTLDVLETLAERGERAPLFIVATTRPDFQARWDMRQHHSLITMKPLCRSQVLHMVAQLSPNHTIPPNVMEDLVARTGGVPLFIEEVTKLLSEQSENTWTEVIPPSLQHLLMARLDGLGKAREVALIGAVIGRRFCYKLLREVADMRKAVVDAALEQLAKADIVRVEGNRPNANYSFKHALIQDAAYHNLLKSRRRAIHRRVAEILREQFPETAAAEPEALAHHFAQAGLARCAVEWCRKAAYRALERSALVEATEHFKRALDHLANLPFNSEIRREQISLQVALINPLVHVTGHAAPEARDAVERARLMIEESEALGEPVDDPLMLFSVLYGVWIAHFVAFDGDVVHELADQFLRLAERRGITIALMIGHRIVGTGLLFKGHLVEGCANLDRAESLYNPQMHRQLATRFSVDPAASSMFYRAQGLWCLGYPDAACAALECGLREAREVQHAATWMFALHMASTIHVMSRDYARAAIELDELAKLTDESGASYWEAFGKCVRGCLLAESGNAADAVRVCTEGISALRLTGARAWTPWYLLGLARAYAKLGCFEDAKRHLTDALATMEVTKETWCEAEIHRTIGEIALISPERDVDEAEANFARALSVARAQQAKSWELRTILNLTALYCERGKWNEARDNLAQVFEWFTEGHDTFDLKQAQAAMARLGPKGQLAAPSADYLRFYIDNLLPSARIA